MNRITAAAAVLALLACAAGAPARAQDPEAATAFSKGKVDEQVPKGWENRPINAMKTPTDYDLAVVDGTVVLHARAKAAASMFMRNAQLDVSRQPVVRWRWKVGTMPEGADNTVAGKEDSGARVVFVFDGDRSSLSLKDRTVLRFAKSLSGQDMPYATLMYVTSSAGKPGDVISNPHTRRVQMIVASTNGEVTGRWQAVTRNVRDDFKRAFGEDPGKLVAYGVMTDSDNTGTTAEAWYGDIVFDAQ